MASKQDFEDFASTYQSKPSNAFTEFEKSYTQANPVVTQPKSSGNLLTDIPKGAIRGLAQLPDVIAQPLQTVAGYGARSLDRAYGNQGVGPVEANVNYGLGTARDYTTRALSDYAEKALPYSQETQEAQQRLGQDVQAIEQNPDLGMGSKVLQAGKAALLNPRGSLPSLAESIPQFFAGSAALKAAGVGASALKQSVGLNAALEGAGGSKGAQETIAQTPLETLQKSPQFQDLVQRYGVEQALKIAEETAGTGAYLPSAVGGGLASAITGGGGEGRLLSKLLSEGGRETLEPGLKGAAKYAGKEVARTAAREVPEETLQGISGQFGQNVGEQPYTGAPLTQNLATQGAVSGVAGLFGGGVFGLSGTGIDIARGPLTRAANQAPPTPPPDPQWQPPGYTDTKFNDIRRPTWTEPSYANKPNAPTDSNLPPDGQPGETNTAAPGQAMGGSGTGIGTVGENPTAKQKRDLARQQLQQAPITNEADAKFIQNRIKILDAAPDEKLDAAIDTGIKAAKKRNITLPEITNEAELPANTGINEKSNRDANKKGLSQTGINKAEQDITSNQDGLLEQPSNLADNVAQAVKDRIEQDPQAKPKDIINEVSNQIGQPNVFDQERLNDTRAANRSETERFAQQDGIDGTGSQKRDESILDTNGQITQQKTNTRTGLAPTHRLNDGYDTLVRQEEDGSFTTLDGQDNYSPDELAEPLTPEEVASYEKQDNKSKSTIPNFQLERKNGQKSTETEITQQVETSGKDANDNVEIFPKSIESVSENLQENRNSQEVLNEQNATQTPTPNNAPQPPAPNQDTPAERVPTPSAPEKAVNTGAVVEASPGQVKAASNLRKIAEATLGQSQAEQGKERATHTPRKARQAAGSIENALKQEALAKTIMNIADAHERGETKALSKITNKAQVETLDTLVNQAKYAHDRAKNISYSEQQRQQGRPVTDEDIQHIKHPVASIHQDNYRKMKEKLSAVRGGKTILNNMPLGGNINHESYEKIKKLVGAKEAENIVGWYPVQALKEQTRLKLMGINNQSDLENAAKEYIQFKQGKREEDKAAKLERELVGKNVGVDFFPTPKTLAQRMTELADVKQGSRVLEPSAGNGNLADAAKAKGANVDTVELSSTLRDVLQAKGHNVVAHDFADYTPNEKYDSIIMNPPFSKNQDSDHIQRAFDMVKPGGKLVAIAGEGVFFRSDKKSQDFRDWLEQNNAEVEKLPAGTFQDKTLQNTTGVNARLITIQKPQETNVKETRKTEKAPQGQETAAEAKRLDHGELNIPGRTNNINAELDQYKTEQSAQEKVNDKANLDDTRRQKAEISTILADKDFLRRKAKALNKTVKDVEQAVNTMTYQAMEKFIEAYNRERTPQNIPDILRKTKKQYILDQKRAWLKEHKNALPQAKEKAFSDFETNYDVEIERAHASLPFEQYKDLPENKGQSDGVLRQVHEQLQTDYGVASDSKGESKPQEAKATETSMQKTAADLANDMQKMRNNKPRSLKQLFGKTGPTLEQKAAHEESEKKWNAAYRKLSKLQKETLEKENAEFSAKTAQKTPESIADGEKVDKKFSQNTPATGSTRADLINRLDANDKKLLQSGRLNIVQSVSDIPKAVLNTGDRLTRKNSVPAWHGSPHDHNKFDSSKIGTGEGAQAFGYGHYFTDKKEIAEWYRTELSTALKPDYELYIDGVKIPKGADRVLDYLSNHRGDFDETVAYFTKQYEEAVDQAERFSDIFQDPKSHVSEYKMMLDFAEGLEESGQKIEVKNKNSGKLYQVELAPEQDELLDWDKPLSEQSDKVKIAFRKIGYEVDDDYTGENFYRDLTSDEKHRLAISGDFSSKAAKFASNKLHSLGIRGIRYKAEDGKSDAYNYVIFSDDDISIKEKYSKDEQIEGFYKDGKIYIIADNVTPENLSSVLNHEKLHASLDQNPKLKERLLGAQSELNDIFDLVESGQYTGRYKELYDAAMKRVDKAKTAPDARREEFLAYAISVWEKSPQSLPARLAKAIANLIAAIKVAIFKYTGKIAKISPADLSALAVSSMKSLELPTSSNAVVMASKAQSKEQQEYPIAPRSEWYGEGTFKKEGARMVYMSPDEYLSNVKALTLDNESRENIDLLKEHIESGGTLDPLLIRESGKEDGRHRAYAAKELGINQVPVIIFGEKFSNYSEVPESLYEESNDIRFSVAPPQKSSLWNRWFGQSKMKRGGEPIKFYHGSNADFTVFDKGDTKSTRHPSAELGHFFAEDKGAAYTYGGKVHEVYLSMQNPYIITSELLDKRMGEDPAKFAKKLKQDGFDGIYIKDAKYAIIFDSNQAKLTSNESPTFGSDIRYSIADDVKDFITGTDRTVNSLSDIDTILQTGKMPQKKIDMQSVMDKAATMLVDATRPFDVLMRKIPNIELASHVVRDKDLAKRRVAVKEKEALDTFLKPLAKIIGEVSKDIKFDYRATHQIMGEWMTVRYALEKNKDYIRQDQEAVDQAQDALNNDPTDSQLKSALTRAKNAQKERLDAINEQKWIDPRSEKLQAKLAGGYNNFTAKAQMAKYEGVISKVKLEEAAKHVYAMNKWKTALDLSTGKVTQEQIDKWFNSPHYVPLTGDPSIDTSEDELFSHGSVNQQTDKRAIGRTGSIAQNGIDAAVEQVQKSARYYGWGDFKDSLYNLYDGLIQEELDNGATMREAQDAVMKNYQLSRSPLREGFVSETGITYRKGNEKWVFDLHNQEAVDALKSINKEEIPSLLQPIANFTRTYSRFVTQLMPGFGAINAIRDTWERTENIRARALPGYETLNMNKVANDAIKNASHPSIIKKLMGVMLEGTGLEGSIAIDPNDADIKNIREMIKAGATSTVGDYLAQTNKDLSKQMKDSLSLSSKGWGYVNAWNNAFELVSTYSLYKSLKDNGVDTNTAAAGVLNLMNFSKSGTITGPLKALYVFTNPIFQGGNQLIKTLSTPVGQKRAAAYLLAGMALYGMLRAIDGDDDELGENKMDNQSSFMLERNIHIPFGDVYIKIPIGFGMPQAMWSAAINLDKMMFGTQDIAETAVEIVKSFSRTLAPVSPSEASIIDHPIVWLTQTLTPQIAKPIMNVGMDVNMFGQPLTNTRFARSDKALALQGRKSTPEEYKDIAANLGKMGINVYPEQVREIVRGYAVGPFNEIIKAFVENPNKEVLGRNTVNSLVDRFVSAHDTSGLKERLYYRYRDEMNQVSVKHSLGKELSAEESKLLKLHTTVKKLESKANGKLAAATKAENKRPGFKSPYRKEGERIRETAMNLVIKSLH